MSGSADLLWSENARPVESLLRIEATPPSIRAYEDAYSKGGNDLLVTKKQENQDDISKTFGNVCLEGCNCRGGNYFDYRQPDGQLYDYRRYMRGAFVANDYDGAGGTPSYYGGNDQGYYGSCNGYDTYGNYGGFGRFGRGGMSSMIGALPYLIGQGGYGGFGRLGGYGMGSGLGMVLRTLPYLIGRGGLGLGGLLRWRR